MILKSRSLILDQVTGQLKKSLNFTEISARGFFVFIFCLLDLYCEHVWIRRTEEYLYEVG